MAAGVILGRAMCGLHGRPRMAEGSIKQCIRAGKQTSRTGSMAGLVRAEGNRASPLHDLTASLREPDMRSVGRPARGGATADPVAARHVHKNTCPSECRTAVPRNTPAQYAHRALFHRLRVERALSR